MVDGAHDFVRLGNESQNYQPALRVPARNNPPLITNENGESHAAVVYVFATHTPSLTHAVRATLSFNNKMKILDSRSISLFNMLTPSSFPSCPY